MATSFARLGIFAAVFLILTSTCMLLMFLKPGTAEFVITVVTAGLGVFLGVISTLVIHIERKRQ